MGLLSWFFAKLRRKSDTQIPDYSRLIAELAPEWKNADVHTYKDLVNLGKGNLQKLRASLRRTEHDVQFAFKTVRKQIELIEKGENFEQADLSSLKEQETYYFERKNNLPSLIKKVKQAMMESQEKPISANLREVDHFRPKDKVVCCVKGCGRLHGTVICVHQKTWKVLVKIDYRNQGQKIEYDITDSTILLQQESIFLNNNKEYAKIWNNSAIKHAQAKSDLAQEMANTF